MIDNDFIFPIVYRQMNEREYTNAKSDYYLWLNEMKWITIDKIMEYEYEEGETKSIVPFAISSRGDKWVWIDVSNRNDYLVGLCECSETTGIFYAQNTEEAIIRQIIEYTASSNFYLNLEEAKSYQISEKELKLQLKVWKTKLRGLINDKYIKIIEELSKLSLKHIECQYGEWYALLTLKEQDELINKYLKFDLINKEFDWYT